MNTAAEVAVNKAVVQRLVDEVLNGGDLDLIDDLYTADQARASRTVRSMLSSGPQHPTADRGGATTPTG